LLSSVAVLGLGAALWHCGGATFVGEGSDASTDSSGGGDSGAMNDGGGGNEAGHADGGGDSSATCSPACGFGRECCSGACVNLDNNPDNCGACGTHCTGSTPYCDGTCKPIPCGRDGGTCSNGTCCGSDCCAPNQICCKSEGPQSGPPVCFTPAGSDTTCPAGCAPQCVSDRNAKGDVVPVEGQRVLDALARVPMSTWSYKDDPTVRHLGPMAQDLHAELGLGGSDKSYDPIDAHGVAFASIQTLYAMVKDQNARIEKLESENARLRSGGVGVCK
jgi:hypothetical protein